MTEVIEHKKAKIGKSKRWVPKKWDPIYDQMVLLSCMGLSHKAIGDKFGYGQQQVCNILNTDQAKVLKESIINHIRETGITLGDRLARIEESALKNIEHALTDEDIRKKAPLAVADRSIAFLKGLGKLEGDKQKEIKNTNVFIGENLAAKLIAGMDKANEAALLHNGVEVKALPAGENNGREPRTK